MQPSPKKRPSHTHVSVLRDILQLRTPLLDVRAPLEFNKGALPCSTNLPILTDQERADVGFTFKHEGQAAAQKLGYKLVSGDIKNTRVSAWQAFITHNPQAMVICWRGGQRSQIALDWLREVGCQVQRVPGGYKALRQTCLDVLDAAPRQDKVWWVIAGRTGVQKTALIRQLPNSIDLEHIAHHRGSAFGAHSTPQPNPATFENQLACAYLQHRPNTLVLEDESRTIGRLGLPRGWHERMQQAPLVLIEADLGTRVEHIVAEYVTAPLATGRPPEILQSHYRGALQRIKRRLGGVLYHRIDALIRDAFQNRRIHHDWVYALMHDYYDPMYDYQLANKKARILFRGQFSEVSEYLQRDAAQG